MATLKTTNRRGVTLLAFPEDHKAQVIQTICDATGLSRADAEQGVENLPAKFTALLDDDDFAADLEALGATVEVTRAPGNDAEKPSFGATAAAVTEQYAALRLAYLALSDFHDVNIGHVITKDDAETLGAIHSQVGRVMVELDELAGELMSIPAGGEA